jgi:hypothetical protein
MPVRSDYPRRFPPPWDIEEANAACYIVRDNGTALAYVYFESEPGRRTAAKLLTRDEARRIAANIAKLAEWWGVKRIAGREAIALIILITAARVWYYQLTMT